MWRAIRSNSATSVWSSAPQMLSDRTVHAEQRPKPARFGEMVRIIAAARSSADLSEIYFILADPSLAD